MQEKTIDLRVNTGSVMINLKDSDGELLGRFRFNPADIDIVERADAFIKRMNEMTFPGTDDFESTKKFTDEIKDMFDMLLNYKVSDEIFAKCNPLTPLENGDFYCENVMDGIAKLIEQTMNKRIERKRNKIQRATAKYNK